MLVTIEGICIEYPQSAFEESFDIIAQGIYTRIDEKTEDTDQASRIHM